jgi:hypothetical protein
MKDYICDDFVIINLKDLSFVCRTDVPEFGLTLCWNNGGSMTYQYAQKEFRDSMFNRLLSLVNSQ